VLLALLGRTQHVLAVNLDFISMALQAALQIVLLSSEITMGIPQRFLIQFVLNVITDAQTAQDHTTHNAKLA